MATTALQIVDIVIIHCVTMLMGHVYLGVILDTMELCVSKVSNLFFR